MEQIAPLLTSPQEMIPSDSFPSQLLRPWKKVAISHMGNQRKLSKAASPSSKFLLSRDLNSDAILLGHISMGVMNNFEICNSVI